MWWSHGSLSWEAALCPALHQHGWSDVSGQEKNVTLHVWVLFIVLYSWNFTVTFGQKTKQNKSVICRVDFSCFDKKKAWEKAEILNSSHACFNPLYLHTAVTVVAGKIVIILQFIFLAEDWATQLNVPLVDCAQSLSWYILWLHYCWTAS